MGVLIYIKDMEMPRDCYECDADFAQAIHCNHWMEGTYMGKGRPKRCPLAELDDNPTYLRTRRVNVPEGYSPISGPEKGDTITIKAEAIT